jgi:PadR family transcriptional regulator, regulatory protein PadR
MPAGSRTPSQPSEPPDLLQGTLDMLILKTLAAAGPQHGYAIVRRLRQVSEQVLQVEEGSLYPALHRLEKRGYLDSHWNASENNRRAKFYRLTPRGRAQLKAEAAAWEQLSGAIDKVMNAHSISVWERAVAGAALRANA